MATIEEKVQQIREVLPGLLKEQAQRSVLDIYATIDAEYFDEGLSAGAFTAGEIPDRRGKRKLGIRSGKLTRSFVQNQAGNVFQVTAQDGKTVVLFGTRIIYAPIHEFGGFIASKGKMEGYFWWQHQKTKLEVFRRIALSVRKNGGVKIPARPFFHPGIRGWERERLPARLLQMAQKLKEVWDG